MIDDVDMENGPMMVVPGSHKGPIHDHHGPDGRFCGAMDPENCDVDLSRAVPCLGKAGSITIHHVRAVHGSATNFSGRPRRFLLFQYRAADAWPLLGLKEGIEKFNEQLIVGEPSLAPRLVPLPVRMPLPPAEYQGSIYENQRASDRRYFATPDEAPALLRSKSGTQASAARHRLIEGRVLRHLKRRTDAAEGCLRPLYPFAAKRRNSRFIALIWPRYVATSWSPHRSPVVREKPRRAKALAEPAPQR